MIVSEQTYQYGPRKLAIYLHLLIGSIWETEQLPEELKEEVIYFIYKKVRVGEYSSDHHSKCGLPSRRFCAAHVRILNNSVTWPVNCNYLVTGVILDCFIN